MNVSEIFSKKLKQCRSDKNLTQRQVAEMSGLTPATISAYEKGVKNPSFESAVLLANTLDVSLDWLCGKESVLSEPQTYADVIDSLTVLLKHIKYEIRDNVAGDKQFCLIINDIELSSFFDGLQKMKQLLDDKIIDKDIFDSWIEGQQKKYKSYPLATSEIGKALYTKMNTKITEIKTEIIDNKKIKSELIKQYIDIAKKQKEAAPDGND